MQSTNSINLTNNPTSLTIAPNKYKEAKQHLSPEELRQWRATEKQYRKERRERAIARDKLEMEFLRKRNEELERAYINFKRAQNQT